MATYRVTWEIDIEADSPLEAAQKALKIQRNPESQAVVFGVDGETVDLLDESDEDSEDLDESYRNAKEYEKGY